MIPIQHLLRFFRDEYSLYDLNIEEKRSEVFISIFSKPHAGHGHQYVYETVLDDLTNKLPSLRHTFNIENSPANNFAGISFNLENKVIHIYINQCEEPPDEDLI